MGNNISSFNHLSSEEPETKDRYELSLLSNESDLYKQIELDFEKAGMKVVKIEKLANLYLWQKYNDCKKQLTDRLPLDPDFQLNESFLYHGTKGDKEKLCEEGFDVNLASKKGCFGRGIYFSDNPKKCLKYSKNIVLIAKVILGEIKVYDDGIRNTELVREPEKEGNYKGWRYYDSVKGRPRNHLEFVIYRNASALLEYIVTFSKAKEDTSAASEAGQNQATQVLPSSDSHSKDEQDETESEDSSSSSSDEGDDKDDSSSSSDEEETYDETIDDSCAPQYVKPQGELNLEDKKAFYQSITQEKNDDEVNRIFHLAEEDLDIAIFLYYADKQVKEEEKMKERGVWLEEKPEADDGSARFPLMKPEYQSKEWNDLEEKVKNEKMNKMAQDFLYYSGLEEEHLTLVQKLLSDANYKLDVAMFNFYEALMD